MKRPVAIKTKVHEEVSDPFSSTAPDSGQPYLDEPLSPCSSTNNGALSDSESASDGFRGTRKKRNTYQKISDDIRVNLLEAVQNGETLKAAAKRHKINYSSAKSILHTYRKEGRILKKSAQERTIKKKEATPEREQAPKPVKQWKKENLQPPKSEVKVTQPVTFSSDKKKPLSRTTSSNIHEGGNPLGCATSLNNNSTPVSKNNQNDIEGGAHRASTEATMSHQKEGENRSKMTHGMDHGHLSDMHYMGPMDTHHNNLNKVKYYDNYHSSYMGNEGVDHVNGDGHEAPNFLSMSSDPFNDMMHHSIHGRSYPHDDFYGHNSFHLSHGFGMPTILDDKGRVENGLGFDDHSDMFSHCPLKSFMDTQNLFREALKKASFINHGPNLSGRKDSIDFFKN